MRRSTFVVDAENVQGSAGATATFRAITVGEYNEYISDPAIGDRHIVRDHLVDWDGFVNDNDEPLPSPKDDPDATNTLYFHESSALAILLVQGPDGENASKN